MLSLGRNLTSPPSELQSYSPQAAGKKRVVTSSLSHLKSNSAILCANGTILGPGWGNVFLSWISRCLINNKLFHFMSFILYILRRTRKGVRFISLHYVDFALKKKNPRHARYGNNNLQIDYSEFGKATNILFASLRSVSLFARSPLHDHKLSCVFVCVQTTERRKGTKSGSAAERSSENMIVFPDNRER
jgi:hypothetical protein